MTREEELTLIDQAIASGRLRQISHEEAEAYVPAASRLSAKTIARNKRRDFKVGNASAKKARENTYRKEGIVL